MNQEFNKGNNEVIEKSINLFKIGSLLDVSDIFEYQRVVLERISNCGVVVSGPNCTPHTTISGNAPAHLHNPNKLIKKKDVSWDDIEVIGATKNDEKITIDNMENKITELKDQIEKLNNINRNKSLLLANIGKVIKPVKVNSINFIVPSNGSFTVKDVMKLNNSDDMVSIRAFLDSKCTRCGFHSSGGRGKPAVLYKSKN